VVSRILRSVSLFNIPTTQPPDDDLLIPRELCHAPVDQIGYKLDLIDVQTLPVPVYRTNRPPVPIL
jgi:hypothetical protein